MNRLLSEELKFDMGINPQILAPNAMAISGEFPMTSMRKALFQVLITSADLQNGDVLDIGVVGDDVVAPAASGDLAVLALAEDTLLYENITASVRATAMSVDLTGAADGAITLNDVEFPYAAVPATDYEWDDDAALVAAINAAGLGLTATAPGANVVTIESTIPGDKTITLTETVTAVGDADILTLQAIAYLEVDASRMGDAESLLVVVDNPVANTGTITAAVACVRLPDYKPAAQAVAAGAHL